MPTGRVHDLIGVGFGPSNIALAIALVEMGPDIDHVFLERRESTFWQDGMLLDGSDIQNNPLRDLVTPRNPQSRYTFVNYLKQTGRLFDYLNLGLQYPLRKDYAHYVMWVAEHFRERVAYRSEVEATELVPGPEGRGTGWRGGERGGGGRGWRGAARPLPGAGSRAPAADPGAVPAAPGDAGVPPQRLPAPDREAGPGAVQRGRGGRQPERGGDPARPDAEERGRSEE